MFVFFFTLLTAFASPMEDVTSLVEGSPRVAGSPGGYQAQAYVLAELQKSGWSASMKVGPTPSVQTMLAHLLLEWISKI